MTDDSIVKKVLRGEIQYFSELVDKYESLVYRTCYKFTRNNEDALDLCQEIFIKIYNNLDKFTGASSLSTWIYKISVNTCLNFLRTRDSLVLDTTDLEKTLAWNSGECSMFYEPKDYVEMK